MPAGPGYAAYPHSARARAIATAASVNPRKMTNVGRPPLAGTPRLCALRALLRRCHRFSRLMPISVPPEMLRRADPALARELAVCARDLIAHSE